MIYQLKSGKIINISIEAYLRMSDDELKYMDERNMGSTASFDPFINADEIIPSAETELESEIEIEIDIASLDPDLFMIEDPNTDE